MPAHRTIPLLILSEDDRRFLEQVRDSRTEEVRRVERAGIILAYAEGRSVPSVAQITAVSTRSVYRYVKKALAFGPRAALEDLRPLRTSCSQTGQLRLPDAALHGFWRVRL